MSNAWRVVEGLKDEDSLPETLQMYGDFLYTSDIIVTSSIKYKTSDCSIT